MKKPHASRCWTQLGTATATSPGLFDFDDPAPITGPRWFYKADQSLSRIKPANIPGTLTGDLQTNKNFDLQITGLATNYTAFASTNLTQWTPLGSTARIGPATFQFTDTIAPAYPNRFYRAQSPLN